jgi:hypothetical protein
VAERAINTGSRTSTTATADQPGLLADGAAFDKIV